MARLDEFGFKDDPKSPAYIGAKISGLSGGWKMKLALCRAILMNADIMLLDEPTNHLDVKNVAWLENFLCSQKDKTSLIITHDSGFLDRVVTHIIHYEDNRKLKNYKGNLSAFVKRVPRDPDKIAHLEKEAAIFLAEVDDKVAALTAKFRKAA